MSKMREAFERWVISRGFDVTLCDCGCNDYLADEVRFAWVGYQAAIAADDYKARALLYERTNAEQAAMLNQVIAERDWLLKAASSSS